MFLYNGSNGAMTEGNGLYYMRDALIDEMLVKRIERA